MISLKPSKLSITTILICLFLIYIPTNNQHFQNFQTGYTVMPILPYNLTNNTYRSFSCYASNYYLTINGSFIFSIISFNYFVNQSFCKQPVKNYNSYSYIVYCSPNIYRIAFMFFDRGPNIFSIYNQRVYSQSKTSTSDIVDISSWMKQVKFPLKSLIKLRTKTQYEIIVANFITGVSIFTDTNNSILSIKNSFGSVKLGIISLNATLDNQTKLLSPVAINVSTSVLIQKVSFYSLIVIKQMISLNFNFQTFSLQDTANQTNFGYFAGINQLSFYIPDKNKSSSQTIAFNTNYNYSSPRLLYNTIFQRILYQKVTSYSKGSNLNIKITKITEFFYRRCSNSSLFQYYPYDIPKQNKLYKFSAFSNSSLAWTVTSQGKITLSLWNNSLSQKFYLYYTGSSGVILMSALLSAPVRCKSLIVNDSLGIGNSTDKQSDIVWNMAYGINNTNYFFFQTSTMRIGTQNDTSKQGNFIIQQVAGTGLTNLQRFLITEIYPPVINDLPSNSTAIYANITLDYRKYVFSYLSEALQTTNLASSAPYSYYSIQEQKCYDRGLIDSQLKYGSANNYLLPYFMDANKTLSNITLNKNANISLINTTTLEFAQGYVYGVCVNKTTLTNFFIQISSGWTGFVLQNVTGIISNISTVNNSSSQTTNNTTIEQPVINIPVGCSKIKIINITLMQYQCQICKDGYTLFQPISQANSSLTQFKAKQCFCSIGFYKNIDGVCISCSSHPTNCKPHFGLSAFISSSSSTKSSSQNKMLFVTLQILNDQFNYNFLNSFQTITSSLNLFVNNDNYIIQKENVKICQNQAKLVNVSLCLNIIVQNIKQDSQYRVSIRTATQTNNSIINSYLLINQTQIIDTSPSQHISQSFYNVKADINSIILASTSQSISRIYFSKIQTYQTIIKQPFTVQKVVDTIQPAMSSINASSSVILLAAPFLMDKINIFSILQTNSILYMMSFLKFQDKNGDLNQIQNIAKKIFIFKPQPFFKPFSLAKTQNVQKVSNSQIQLPRYLSQFQNNFIYNSSIYGALSYPQILYRQAIPQINDKQGSQNYLTLTLNSLLNMGLQIILIQGLIMLVIYFCSTRQYKKQDTLKGDTKQVIIKKKIEYDIKRHRYINLFEQKMNKKWQNKQNITLKYKQSLMLQKRIQWKSLPQINQCQKIILQQKVNQKKQQQNKNIQSNQIQIHSQIHSQIEQQIQQNSQPTIKQQILFFIYQLKQKKIIFYTSFIIIQLISQSYLLYFQLIKPLDTNSNNLTTNVLNYIDSLFSLIMMFIIIIFPVFLINYQPLHLLKIVQITCKFGGIKFNNQIPNIKNLKNKQKNKNCQNNFINKSYTYGEIYFHFCIIYYEVIMIPFSIAIGPTILYQSIPIFVYQLFKLIWTNKKIKFFDRIKTIILCLIFLLSGGWDFIQQGTILQNIIQNLIIWCMYIVLLIQFIKLLKFAVVFLIKSMRLKQGQNKQKDKQNQQLKNLQKQKSSSTNQISIITLQQEPTTNILKQSGLNYQFGSQKYMLQKKKEKLQNLKKKSKILKELTQMRESLQSDLQNVKNKRKNEFGKIL